MASGVDCRDIYDQVCDDLDAARAEIARLRGLVAEHHAINTMATARPGAVCPVCAKHDPETRRLFAPADRPAASEEERP